MKRIKKAWTFLLCLCMITALFPITASAAGGTLTGGGTLDDPYQISDAADLAAFRDIVNGTNGSTADSDACAELTASVDLSSICSEGVGSWTPIGTEDSPFTGIFDGCGYSVGGLYIDNTHNLSSQGLFGYVEAGGAIKNLTVSGSVQNNGNSLDHMGGIAGYNAGTIDNCRNECIVSSINKGGNGNIGGVAGNNEGQILNSLNIGDITGGITITWDSFNTGGISGRSTGEIIGCSNSGTISGSNMIGGIVGRAESNSSRIERCSNSGTVKGGENEYDIGGIAGMSYGAHISDCFNTGAVKGAGHDEWNSPSYIGGIAGESLVGAVLENCYNTGTVSGNDSAGPITSASPFTAAAIENCYYLASSETEAAAGMAGKTESQFMSGEVAYLLNNGISDGTQAFYQTCGIGLPAFSGDTVYQVTSYKCPGDTTGTAAYSNSNENITGAHSFAVENTDAKYLKSEADCAGPAEYYKSCEFCAAASPAETFTSGDKDPSSHAGLTKVNAVAPTCTKDGNVEYWHCNSCGKDFEDEHGTKAISDTSVPSPGHKAQKVEAEEATASEDGNIAYWYCPECGQYFSDEALTKVISLKDTVIPATGETEDPKDPEGGDPSEGTDPGDTKPEDTKPEDTKPEDTKPEDTKPDGDKPEATPAPTKTEDKGSKDSPLTGDSSNLLLLTAALLAASGGIAGITLYSKKRR